MKEFNLEEELEILSEKIEEMQKQMDKISTWIQEGSQRITLIDTSLIPEGWDIGKVAEFFNIMRTSLYKNIKK